MAASPNAPSAPPSKKSIFNKPAWAKAAPVSHEPDPEDSTDFFRRSDRTLAIVTAEQEARRKKRKAKKEYDDAARPSGTEGSSKRRRTTESVDDDERIHVASKDHGHSNGQASKDSRSNAKPPARSSSPPAPRGTPPKPRERHEQKTDSIAAARLELERMMNSNTISLDSDEEANHYPSKLSKPVAKVFPPKRSEIDDFEASDEEELFPELARKARDDARQKCLQQDTPNGLDTAPTSNGTVKRPTALGATDASFAAENRDSVLKSSYPQPPPPDPIISIFVQSAIPDTIPFILNRKLKQRLKEVRQYWCKRQNFPPGLADSVILTWRGRRIFDVTSCAALGLEVNGAGKVVIKGEGNIFSDEEEDGGAQIHMEAMTEEMFAERQREKAASQRVEEEVEDKDEVEEGNEAEKEAQVRIILKSKDYKEFYLLVKPSNKVSDVVKAFRSANKLAIELDVRLHFDGEELEPEMAISETELSDMDYIDVYVK